MSRIWRYQLPVVDRQMFTLPLGYKLLSVAPGRGDDYHIDLWVQVPEEAPGVPVEFQIVGTGHLIPQARLEFIGTAVMLDGFVWHVFERIDQMRKS